ncbi:Uncharacterised protein [Vibrio cholerae]|nr:Uncharacterised protein [Vibrio cholerae]CSD43968.1 Uncharacterised protein [Vibrio cholerae]
MAQLNQIRLQTHHDRLGFWVTKAAVVLNHFRCTSAINHQTRVEEACVGVAFGCHAAHGWVNHFTHYAIMDVLCHHWRW